MKLIVNRDRYEVNCDGRTVLLTPYEWHILEHLTARPGAVVSSRTLSTHVLGYDNRERIAWHITNLRHKLGKDTILSRRGFGWYLTVPVEVIGEHREH